jgi:hypothetical protein
MTGGGAGRTAAQYHRSKSKIIARPPPAVRRGLNRFGSTCERYRHPQSPLPDFRIQWNQPRSAGGGVRQGTVKNSQALPKIKVRVPRKLWTPLSLCVFPYAQHGQRSSLSCTASANRPPIWVGAGRPMLANGVYGGGSCAPAPAGISTTSRAKDANRMGHLDSNGETNRWGIGSNSAGPLPVQPKAGQNE